MTKQNMTKILYAPTEFIVPFHVWAEVRNRLSNYLVIGLLLIIISIILNTQGNTLAPCPMGQQTYASIFSIIPISNNTSIWKDIHLPSPKRSKDFHYEPKVLRRLINLLYKELKANNIYKIKIMLKAQYEDKEEGKKIKILIRNLGRMLTLELKDSNKELLFQTFVNNYEKASGVYRPLELLDLFISYRPIDESIDSLLPAPLGVLSGLEDLDFPDFNLPSIFERAGIKQDSYPSTMNLYAWN